MHVTHYLGRAGNIFVAVLCAIALSSTVMRCSDDPAGEVVSDAGGGSQGGKDTGGGTTACKTKIDCGGGEECVGGRCVPAGDDGGGDGSLPNGDADDCTISDACGQGYRCNPDTKRCEDAGVIKVEPDLLDFGAVPFNSEVKRTLVVSNAGRASLKVSGVEFENGTNPDTQNPIFVFTASKAVPVTLAPAESFNVEVTFRQDDARPDVGALLITSTDDSHPLTRVPLKSGYKGTPDLAIVDSGIAPPTVLYPLSGSTDDFTVDLGNVDIGASKEVVVTFLNTTAGDAILSIDEVKVHKKTDNEFLISFKDPLDPSRTLPVPAYVGAGAMVDMHVVYAPTMKVENEQTDLDLVTNDDDVNNDGAAGGNILYVKLRAKGGWAPPGISVDKASVDFGEVQVNSAGTDPVRVCNTGTTPLNLKATSGLETSGTAFSISPASLGMALAAAGCVDVAVTFSPIALGKADNKLVIDSDDPINPQIKVALTGTGTNPTIAVDPQSIDFGDVAFGVPATPVKVTVKNTGVGSLAVSSIALTQGSAADFSIVNPPVLPGTLVENQGNSIEFTVAFTPSLVGPGIAGAVQIDNGDNKNAQLTIPLNGNGVNRKPDGETCNVDGECAGSHCCTGICSSWKDPANCGGCGVPCARDHAAPSCATGVCKIGTCDSGHASCDNDDANGCELALNGYPAGNTCNSPEDSLSSCGDERWWTVTGGCHTAQWAATPFATKTGNTSKWFTAKALNCIKLWCTGPVHNLVQLTVPTGVEYDLCTYTQGVCSSPTCTHATSTAPATATVTAGKDEVDYPYTVEVRFASGSSCDPWTLTLTGVLQN